MASPDARQGKPMATIHLWSPDDRSLGILGALALAATAGTALVVDADPGSHAFGGRRSLAEVVADDPTGEDLRPRRRGVAVLANGGVTLEGADRVLEAMASGWPALVLVSAVPARPGGPKGMPLVPVLPLVPPDLRTRIDGPAVYQRTSWTATRRPAGIVLPRPLPGELPVLARHRIPVFGRWMRAWRRVWSYPWA